MFVNQPPHNPSAQRVLPGISLFAPPENGNLVLTPDPLHQQRPFENVFNSHSDAEHTIMELHERLHEIASRSSHLQQSLGEVLSQVQRAKVLCDAEEGYGELEQHNSRPQGNRNTVELASYHSSGAASRGPQQQHQGRAAPVAVQLEPRAANGPRGGGESTRQQVGTLMAPSSRSLSAASSNDLPPHGFVPRRQHVDATTTQQQQNHLGYREDGPHSHQQASSSTTARTAGVVSAARGAEPTIRAHRQPASQLQQVQSTPAAANPKASTSISLQQHRQEPQAQQQSHRQSLQPSGSSSLNSSPYRVMMPIDNTTTPNQRHHMQHRSTQGSASPPSRTVTGYESDEELIAALLRKRLEEKEAQLREVQRNTPRHPAATRDYRNADHY